MFCCCHNTGEEYEMVKFHFHHLSAKGLIWKHDSCIKPSFNDQVPAQPSLQLLALKTCEGYGDFLFFLLLFQADSPKIGGWKCLGLQYSV